MDLEPRLQTLAYVVPKPLKRSKRNPLHLESSWGCPPDRQIGTSTAIALKTIAEAISKPYCWIQVVDHFGTNEANFHLFLMIKQMCNKLELRQMYFRVSKNHYIAFGDPK